MIRFIFLKQGTRHTEAHTKEPKEEEGSPGTQHTKWIQKQEEGITGLKMDTM